MATVNFSVILFTGIYFLVQTSLAADPNENEKLSKNNGNYECPRQCNCEFGPLRAAAFVVTWMTSWGEDDVLPNVHPNDILNADLMVKSLTAKDASVNVDVIGLHATCSLHPTTNVSLLLRQLPKETMVLSILQSPGCNLTIIDGGQLSGLGKLKGLHLQGYAHNHRQQVSGYKPNSVSEMVEHKRLLDQELRRVEGKKKDRELALALAEDALQPLNKLQLVDLQFVRLVASKEERRSRRYSSEPVSATTLLDLPLQDFMKFVANADTFDLPPHLRHLFKSGLDDIEDNAIDNRLKPSPGDSYIVRKNLFRDEQLEEEELQEKVPGPETIRQNLHLLNDERKGNMIDALTDSTVLVPYEIYREGMKPKLAPFTTLKELKYLRVAHARLDRVGPELLDGLNELHTLTLEFNQIKILPEGLFSPTPNLRHLSLAHNNIFSLEASSLQDLQKLLTLDLDYNKISVLGSSCFPSFPSLLTLRAIGNPISQLLPDAFSKMNLTENMYLGSSNISIDVHENTFRFLSALKTLVLKNVTRENLQKKILGGMVNLEELTIHGVIPEIAFDAFSNTILLQSLNLSSCSIEKISIDSFYGLSTLTKLDLSHNQISTLSPGTFDHLTAIKELYLYNNLLTTLPLGIFLPVPAKLIQLYNNPWECTCDLLQLSPSVTNKVVKPGTIKCEWNDKLTTVCQLAEDKFVYDARVAPLCFEPLPFQGIDVYHAALRHLECSKFHWDPSLLKRFSPQEEGKTDRSLKRMKPIVKNLKREKAGKIKKPSWLPLISFTPEPYSKDLLDIAEGEDLEEVIDDAPTTETTLNTEEEVKISKEVSNEAQNDHQNDQPIIKQRIRSMRGPHALKYQLQKKKLKGILRAQELKRQATKMAHLKNIRQLSLQQKMKIKAMLHSKQKKLHLHAKKKNAWKRKYYGQKLKNSLMSR